LAGKGQAKKSKKHGRSLRKPSHIRYKAENRSEKNKEKRIAKQKRKEAKAKAKKEARQKKAQ